MFSSLRFRLWLTYLFLAGVVIIIAFLAIAVYFYRNPVVDRREFVRLRLLSNLIVQRNPNLSIFENDISTERLEQVLSRADVISNARYAIFDEAGKLLADSRASKAASLPDLSFFERPRKLQGSIFRDKDRVQWLFVVNRLGGGQLLVVATPRVKMPVFNIIRDDFAGPFFRGLLFALGLSLLMAIWISSWVTAPLERLAEASKAVSRGEYKKIQLKGPSEVKTVAATFNDMVERVQVSQRSQRDFLANVSHDLKTPLTSIQGFAQAMLDGTVSNPEAIQQAAQVISNEAERMHKMVVDLLELAKVEAGTTGQERAPVQIEELLQSIVDQFIHLSQQSNIDLIFKKLSTEGNINQELYVYADVNQLGQVFSNLIDNAIKFTPSGGNVTISISSRNGWVDISIADTGPGIPVNELDRIFERFYQTDKARTWRNRGGVGLGLAIAKEIVVAHGGTVKANNLGLQNHITTETNVNSQSNVGSVFTVRLPEWQRYL